ncbi:hypothetical protein P153DRAFT_381913 [Dothidotthia symphoricarpi CBS 119687]|uniref:Uncharacterized protein n=1 Tax=Dothidotthia symphoricarpi CBS 119687 TaxID=1392245 RepID=A0A6A6AQK3_9PLEO|nr:uncharacterized protein P153DRAFT_381913 [Dothidotthia symphoricarpi CBS 119687]KAF2133483.1 hypothetical protein P153DRAFT_381913 [Dothidotthia symphoricarpi CBS 119687]
MDRQLRTRQAIYNLASHLATISFLHPPAKTRPRDREQNAPKPSQPSNVTAAGRRKKSSIDETTESSTSTVQDATTPHATKAHAPAKHNIGAASSSSVDHPAGAAPASRIEPLLQPGNLDTAALSVAMQRIADLVSAFHAWLESAHKVDTTAQPGSPNKGKEPASELPSTKIQEAYIMQIQLEVQSLAGIFGAKILTFDMRPPEPTGEIAQVVESLDILSTCLRTRADSTQLDLDLKLEQIEHSGLINKSGALYDGIWTKADTAAPAQSNQMQKLSLYNGSRVPTDSLSIPVFEARTDRQQKQWNRGTKREHSTLWVILQNDKGKSLKDTQMALYTTWQLPKKLSSCEPTDGRAAKRCPSVHYTGYFAGTDLVFSCSFGTCPGCDNPAKSLIHMDFELADGHILAQLNPLFRVDTLGYIRLQDSKPITKNKRTIELLSVYRVTVRTYI